MSRKGGRRSFLTGRGGGDRISSDPTGRAAFSPDLRAGLAAFQQSADSWNRFIDRASGGTGTFRETGWAGGFTTITDSTKVRVEWRDSNGIGYDLFVRLDRLKRDGETAIVRAFNGLRQSLIDAAARAGKPPPRVGRPLKKADLKGAVYLFSAGDRVVYV